MITEPSAQNIRVIIFEDNQLFREAMQAILNGTPGYICCGAFPNVEQLEWQIERCRPDVILMDIEMPGMDGIQATGIINRKYPNARVLIQTVFQDNEKIFQALCAGASGYILKGDSPAAYLTAIKEVYQGGSSINPVIAGKVIGFFANKNVILVAPSNEDYKLTTREKELLHMMVEGDDYRAIAEKSFISYETVRTHVRNIYQKLHVANRTEAVMKAIQQNLA